jgi:WD40 repeat protein
LRISVSVKPNSNHLGVVSSVGIWLYDAVTYQEVALLKEHADVVRSVSFSPNGQVLASSSFDNTIRLWDAGTGRHLRTLTRHTIAQFNGVAFSPYGNMIICGGSG